MANVPFHLTGQGHQATVFLGNHGIFLIAQGKAFLPVDIHGARRPRLSQTSLKGFRKSRGFVATLAETRTLPYLHSLRDRSTLAFTFTVDSHTAADTRSALAH